MTGSWLMSWHPAPTGRPTLLCVPPAGAGCAQFRAWQQEAGDDIAVLGVQLPGRENRWLDPSPASVGDAVDAVLAELADRVAPGQPLVIFGHSFGALLGYEIAKALLAYGRTPPKALVVSAVRPPEHWVAQSPGRRLADDGLADLNLLLDARGLSADDLDEDSRELMLEVLRRDAELSASYHPRWGTGIVCPLEAWGGTDDATVRADHVAGWADYADGGFQQRMFPGGHYFCLEDPRTALQLLGPMTVQVPAMEGKTR
ncbi:thioesterase II family protein [Kutzneria buriramensis]|uniref:Surfactin synthase thioesterase subunit n=1 Tax=Kutzneria buriramensis TaxID=1045776 RepID=A0A3E0HL48_9PSEU|nr:alpha/beta fold hydrolase [Kutzneria buriramensis]REH47189.1 surfactin synthase thioesterase subunit [Kutzneria buriramensis]